MNPNSPAKHDEPKKLSGNSCPNCWKPLALCACEFISLKKNQIPVLILQHPQESTNPLTSARILSLSLENNVHRIGLSWRALNHATRIPMPRHWAVLYLGTQKSSSDTKLPVVVQNRKGQSLPLKDIDGIICLDGNWKQSKTLWWRNPWLLKWPRIYLNPQMSSRFGSLRKEPRKICLSTLEAVAFSLEHLGEKPEVVEGLYKTFEEWLNKAKQIPEETPHE